MMTIHLSLYALLIGYALGFLLTYGIAYSYCYDQDLLSGWFNVFRSFAVAFSWPVGLPFIIFFIFASKVSGYPRNARFGWRLRPSKNIVFIPRSMRIDWNDTTAWFAERKLVRIWVHDYNGHYDDYGNYYAFDREADAVEFKLTFF